MESTKNVAVITEEAYDKRAREVMDELMETPTKDGEKGSMGAMLSAMLGAVFAAKLKEKLFANTNEQ